MLSLSPLLFDIRQNIAKSAIHHFRPRKRSHEWHLIYCSFLPSSSIPIGFPLLACSEFVRRSHLACYMIRQVSCSLVFRTSSCPAPKKPYKIFTWINQLTGFGTWGSTRTSTFVFILSVYPSKSVGIGWSVIYLNLIELFNPAIHFVKLAYQRCNYTVYHTRHI